MGILFFFLSFPFLALLLWFGLPVLHWIGVVRVGISFLFLPTEGKLSAFHHWVWCSVQFSRSVVSNSLWPHKLQHIRPPCPSPTPGDYSNTCSLSQWCHPVISSSVVPFSSCLQSFQASRCFRMSWLFASGGQSIGVSASTSVLPMNTQDWLAMGFSCISVCMLSHFSCVQLFVPPGKPQRLVIYVFN